ncbi:hypothetical protein BDM02DRAFT_3132454 [Thelephora ganbajun]|uniref:Uncharacterized protein n=1 Tax=Thelephora ganbajun TaxID=370292 RepID=A0ACB6Z1L9_THEGA|nr:hypothetical protein BDM02DRAFT_3132454 [Thelephora ganbajun]
MATIYMSPIIHVQERKAETSGNPRKVAIISEITEESFGPELPMTKEVRRCEAMDEFLLVVEPIGKDIGKSERNEKYQGNLNESGTQSGDQIEGCYEGEGRESEGSVEGWDRWHWALNRGRSDGEPGRDWDQDFQEEESRKRARFWTTGHGFFNEMAQGDNRYPTCGRDGISASVLPNEVFAGCYNFIHRPFVTPHLPTFAYPEEVVPPHDRPSYSIHEGAAKWARTKPAVQFNCSPDFVSLVAGLKGSDWKK